MTRIPHKLLQLSLATVIGAVCLALNEKASLTETQSLLSSADARIGRPLTPMSYAGVARRTTRRAVAVGAAGAGVYYRAPVVVAPAPVVVAPRCVQAVDAYGRVYARCY
jgi:hypothetical protein